MPDAAPDSTPAADPPAADVAARYQRQRLWIGIGGIGTILVLQWAGVIGCVPAWINQEARGHAWFGGSLGGALMGLLLGAAAVLVQLPFDLLGRRVEARFGQWRRADGAGASGEHGGGDHSWWRRWWSSAWRWIAAAAMGGLVIGIAWETDASRWLAWSILGLGLLSGIAVTLPIRPGERVDPGEDAAAWASQTRQHIVALGLAWPRIRWYDHGERSLAGGWHGLGPWARLWLSTSMLDVPPHLAAGLVIREIGHADRGDRAFGVLASAAWIAAGLAGSWILAGELLGRGEDTPAGLVFVIATVMSTWSWIGLFVWPALGRTQVFAADRFMLRAGMTREQAVAVLDELAARNRPDEELPGAVAFVFHPIPPMELRRRALRGDGEDLRTADPDDPTPETTPDPTPDPTPEETT
jgi:Zn-dependent protease with chaperone function